MTEKTVGGVNEGAGRAEEAAGAGTLRRVAVCSLLGLLLAAGPAPAEGKEPGKADTVLGGFVSYRDGVLALRVKDARQEFKVPPETPVVLLAGGGSRTVPARDGLKDVPAGAAVAVTLGESGRVVRLQVAAAPVTPGKGP